MSYTVKLGGHDVLCSTPAEVHALIAYKGDVNKTGRVRISTQTSDRQTTTTRAFVRAIMAEPKGITSTKLVEELGFKGTKALGGAMGFVHAYLAEIGLDPSEVYETQKRSDAKYWIAREKAANALETLENK